jgi:predicted unusual protein kinase regulating ubiquinone biosynthesis (AarF/ABC1/UbiB family)
MSRWTEYRGGQRRRVSHAYRREAAPSASPFIVNRNASLEEQAKQIRGRLQELGLGYSCLALYLSSRIDLLPAEFCREFAFTPDSSPPLSVSELQQTLEDEFSAGAKGTFAEFNPTPTHSTLLTHSYVAKLANGVQVIMTILRPECSALRSGPEVPQSFNKTIAQAYCGSAVDDAVFLDFFASLRRKCDFTAQRETLESMAYDGAGCEVSRSRRIYRELCTNRIITFEPLKGLSIEEVTRSGACNTDVLARTLCQAWLYQALRGNGFAVDPQPHNVTLVDNAVLFTTCEFLDLPPGAKENLWNYFMATMGDDPDKAARYLLREMWPSRRAKVDSETFRSKFRQSAYFGALEPILGTNSNALAQLIFQHWKTASEYGYAPKPHLLCFYRGMFSIARIAQRLSPLGDPLREGMEEVRGDRIMGQMTEMVDWRYWFQNSDKFATALVTLPRILDDALTRASAPNQSDPTLDERSRPKTRTASRTPDVMMILIFVAMLLLLQSSNVNPLMEKLGLLLVFLAGLIALRKLGD